MPALGHESKARTIAPLISVLQPLDAADRIHDTLSRFGVRIIATQVETGADSAALARMSPLIHDRLATPAPVIATIRCSVFRKLAPFIAHIDLAILRGAERTRPRRPSPSRSSAPPRSSSADRATHRDLGIYCHAAS